MASRQRISGPRIPEHANPFPACVKIDNLVFSAAIGGDDPETHELPADEASQIENAFATMRNMLSAAGASPANVAKVSVYVKDRSIRPKVNPHWVAMFPDEDDCPVRHMSPSDMPPGRHIQLEFIAVL
ncbi:RidA family protein [Candidatus Rariloculus sp.]|uniref:RidA family protein n=1 Tax=Candidatus Rariloculus sp. TaxID=3101265 RepID=UPI003D14248B